MCEENLQTFSHPDDKVRLELEDPQLWLLTSEQFFWQAVNFKLKNSIISFKCFNKSLTQRNKWNNKTYTIHMCGKNICKLSRNLRCIYIYDWIQVNNFVYMLNKWKIKLFPCYVYIIEESKSCNLTWSTGVRSDTANFLASRTALMAAHEGAFIFTRWKMRNKISHRYIKNHQSSMRNQI